MLYSTMNKSHNLHRPDFQGYNGLKCAPQSGRLSSGATPGIDEAHGSGRVGGDQNRVDWTVNEARTFQSMPLEVPVTGISS